MANGGKEKESRLERVSPYLYFEHWQEGSKPMNWVREWETTTLTVTNLKVAHQHNFSDRRFGSDGECIRLRDRNDDEFYQGEMSNEIKQYEEHIFNESFVTPDSEESYTIKGCYYLEKDSIGLIVGDRASGRKTSGTLYILGKGSLLPGVMFEVAEDVSAITKNIAGDLLMQIHVPNEQQKKIAKEIEALGPRAKLEIHICLLAFRSEVDRSLSESYHAHQFYIEKDGSAAVILLSLSVIPAELEHALTDGQLSEFSSTTESNQAPTMIAGRSVTIALWVIALGVILSLFK
jgi:hypothetical protein